MSIDQPTELVRSPTVFRVNNFKQLNIALASLDRDVGTLFTEATSRDTTGAALQDISALRAVPASDREDKQTRTVEDAPGGTGAGAIYRFDSTGVGVDDGNLIITPTAGSGRWFKVSNVESLPVADTTPVVKGSVDETKLVRIEADGITTGTTRTITMPDKDVTLDDEADARDPNAHASDHTDGTDDIQDATAAQKGLATDTQITKLDGIATGADVTGSNAPQNHAGLHTDGTDDIQDATASQKGLATATQITKLDGISAGATAFGFRLDKTAFVSDANGDDGTAVVGDSAKPFKTVPSALAAGSISRVSVMPGTYTMTTLPIPAGVIVEAVGGKKHETIFDFTGASADAITFADNAELIGISIIGFTMTGNTNYWILIDDFNAIRGCKFAIYDEAHVITTKTNTAALDLIIEDNLFLAADGTAGAAVGLVILNLDSGLKESTNLKFINNEIALDLAASNLNFEPVVMSFAGGKGILSVEIRGNKITGIKGNQIVFNLGNVGGNINIHQNDIEGTEGFTVLAMTTTPSGGADARVSITDNFGLCTGFDGGLFVSITNDADSSLLINDNSIKGFSALATLTLTSGDPIVDLITISHNNIEEGNKVCIISANSGIVRNVQIVGNNFVGRTAVGPIFTLNVGGDEINTVLVSNNLIHFPAGSSLICDFEGVTNSIITNNVVSGDAAGQLFQGRLETVDLASVVIEGNKSVANIYNTFSAFIDIDEVNDLVVRGNHTTGVARSIDIDLVTGGTVIIEDNTFLDACAGVIPSIQMDDFTAAELFLLRRNTIVSARGSQTAIILTGAGATKGIISDNVIRLTGVTSTGIVATSLGSAIGDYRSFHNLIDVTGVPTNYSANVVEEIMLDKTAFVSSVNGNDSTAIVGDSSHPYASPDVAVVASGVSRVSVMPGTYTMTTLPIPAGVKVEAIGGTKHEVEFDFTGASADAITMGIASELIGISFIGFTLTTSSNFWGVLTDECIIRGCKFAIYDEAHVWKNITNDGALNVTFEDNLFIAADGTAGAAVGLTILKLDSGTRASTNLVFIDNVIKLDEAAANLNFEPRVFTFSGGDGIENLLFRGNRVAGIQGTVIICNAAIVTGEVIFHQNEFRGTGTFSPIFLATSSSGDDARISVTENSGVCTTSDGNHFVSISTNSQSMILVSDNNIKGFNNILLSSKSGANDNDSISVNHNSLEGCSALVSVSVSAGAIQSLQIIGNSYVARATGGAGISILGSGVADLIKSVVVSENTFRYPGAVTIDIIAVRDSLNVRITDNQVHAASTMGDFIKINSGTEDVEYLLIDGNKVFEVAYQAGSQFANIVEAKSIVITNNMTTNVGACLNIGTVLGGSLIIADNFFEECGGTSALPAIDVAVFTAADLFILRGNTLTSTQNGKNAIILNGVGASRGIIQNNTIRFTGTTTDGIEGTSLGSGSGDYQSSNNLVDVTGTAYNYSANVDAVNDVT